MDKTHCFYIITTVKPNIRVNRQGAVLPQARGRFTSSMGQNGFIGAHFKLVVTYVLVIQSFRDMCHTQNIYTSTLLLHNYASISYEYKNTQLFPWGAGLPQVTLLSIKCTHSLIYTRQYDQKDVYNLPAKLFVTT